MAQKHIEKSPSPLPPHDKPVRSRQYRSYANRHSMVLRLLELMARMAEPADPLDVDALCARFREQRARIAVIGLGYVGLPLLRTLAERGFPVLGVDIDRAKVDRLNAGDSYIGHIGADIIAGLRAARRFEATDDFSRLGEADAIILCVPTPLTPSFPSPITERRLSAQQRDLRHDAR